MATLLPISEFRVRAPVLLFIVLLLAEPISMLAAVVTPEIDKLSVPVVPVMSTPSTVVSNVLMLS